MIFSCLSVGYTAHAATSSSKLTTLVKKFPNGKYWNHVGSKKNNPDGYTSKPCTHHRTTGCYWKAGYCECNSFDNAIQCMGYAYKTAYDLLGISPRNERWKMVTKLKASDLCVGDIIRYHEYSSVGHSVTVVGVKGNTVAYTGANWGGDCQIKWGTKDISEFGGFEYVLHLDGNKWKNTKIDFFNTGEKPNDAPPEPNIDTTGLEKWVMRETVNLRKSYTTSSDIIGTVYLGDTVYVGKKYYDGTYLWGNVVYGSKRGWIALNYAEYISGEYQRLEMEEISDTVSGRAVKISWNKISGMTSYLVEIYRDGAYEAELRTDKNYINYTPKTEGIYIARLTAENDSVYWAMQADEQSFTVKSGSSQIESLAVSGTANIAVGSTAMSKAVTTPIDAYGGIVWSTSDTSVATVDVEGRVTARGCGTAVITCKSKDDPSITASYKVAAYLQVPKGFSQTAYTKNTISLTWEKVAGANTYRVYRETADGGYKRLIETDKTSTVASGLSPATNYRLVIRAFTTVNGKEKGSAISGAIRVCTAPESVTNLKQTGASSSAIKLSWSKVSKADGYRVYRKTPNGSWKLVEDTKKTTITEGKFSPGKKNEYLVKAYKIAETGSKKASTESKHIFAITAPDAVKNVKVKSDNGSFTLSWSKTTNASRYVVFFYDFKNKVYKKYKTVKSTSLTVKCKESSLYHIRIKAEAVYGDNKTVMGAYSEKAAGFSKPAQVKASAAGQKNAVKITWSKNKYATGYEVYRLSGDKYILVKAVSASTSSYTVKNLKSGVNYTFKVRPVRKNVNTVSNGICTKVKAKAK